MLSSTVCLPVWLVALLAVGAVGSEALHQIALKRRSLPAEQSGGGGQGSGSSDGSDGS